MGNCIRSLLTRLRKSGYSEKSIFLLIVGLDNAGKTLVLNEIAGDRDKNVLPTMGFRTISLKYNSYNVKIYDVGGSSQIRGLWPKYYNGIHGLIYVVDASDISRLTENKLVFSELVSNEHISGKPLLLLANKQDVNGAIDELDLVENLDVEHVANSMRCPTRVETCSCIYEREQFRDSTMGIKNGYKWILDTITSNYTAINSRVKESQTLLPKRLTSNHSEATHSPSKLSIHSNPFRPIKELISKKEGEFDNKTQNGDIIQGTKRLKKAFTPRNKTAPLSSENSAVNIGDITEVLRNDGSTAIECVQTGTQTMFSTLNPLTLNKEPQEPVRQLHRPHTAPECSRNSQDKLIIFNMPGQVIH